MASQPRTTSSEPDCDGLDCNHCVCILGRELQKAGVAGAVWTIGKAEYDLRKQHDARLVRVMGNKRYPLDSYGMPLLSLFSEQQMAIIRGEK